MRGEHDKALFARNPLRDSLWLALQRHGSVESAINEIPRHRFLATPDTDIANHVFSRFSIEPLLLHEDHMRREYKEINLGRTRPVETVFRSHAQSSHIPAYRIEISVPYTGDIELWDLRPNAHYTTPPDGDVHAPIGDELGKLIITFIYPVADMDETRVENDINQTMNAMRFHITNQSADIAEFNSRLRTTIESLIAARRASLLESEGIMDRLGIRLDRSPDAPSIEPIHLEQRIITPLPAASEYEFSPEPGLDSNQYDHILSVIRHITRTYETTPATFRGLSEEELRDLILAHLNAYFKGSATGETFRKLGKTDVRIENDNRAAFVAECKVWKGSASFLAAIDQLLGYLIWRDCKAAIIVFNKRNSGFSEIRSKISSELPNHDLTKREIQSQESEAEWRYVFRSSEDELREVTVHVFAVNLFVGDSAKA